MDSPLDFHKVKNIHESNNDSNEYSLITFIIHKNLDACGSGSTVSMYCSLRNLEKEL